MPGSELPKKIGHEIQISCIEAEELAESITNWKGIRGDYISGTLRKDGHKFKVIAKINNYEPYVNMQIKYGKIFASTEIYSSRHRPTRGIWPSLADHLLKINEKFPILSKEKAKKRSIERKTII